MGDMIRIRSGLDATFRSRGRCRVAAVAAAGMLAAGCTGVTLGSGEPGASDGSTPASAVSTPGAVRDLSPRPVPIPSPTVAAIRRAVEADTCAQRVTVADVTEGYRIMFGEQERPDMTVAELTERADDVIAALEAGRRALGFLPMPEEYPRLAADVAGPGVIPLTVYQQTVRDYLAAFGVNAVFDWKPSHPLAVWATPVHEKSGPTGGTARALMTATLQWFGRTLPDQIRHSGLTEVAFGAVKVTTADGSTAAGLATGTTAILNVRVGGSEPGGRDVIGDDLQLLSHEIFGHIGATTRCGETLEHADPAIASFTPGFRYYPRSYADEDAMSHGYTPLRGCQVTGTAKEGFVDLYSMTNPAEDRATVAALLHDPFTLFGVYASCDRPRPALGKLAFQLARILKADPELRPYLSDVFAAARVRQAAEDQWIRLLTLTADAVDPYTGMPTGDPAAAALIAERDRYDAIDRRVAEALHGF